MTYSACPKSTSVIWDAVISYGILNKKCLDSSPSSEKTIWKPWTRFRRFGSGKLRVDDEQLLRRYAWPRDTFDDYGVADDNDQERDEGPRSAPCADWLSRRRGQYVDPLELNESKWLIGIEECYTWKKLQYMLIKGMPLPTQRNNTCKLWSKPLSIFVPAVAPHCIKPPPGQSPAQAPAAMSGHTVLDSALRKSILRQSGTTDSFGSRDEESKWNRRWRSCTIEGHFSQPSAWKTPAIAPQASRWSNMIEWIMLVFLSNEVN